MLIKVTTVTDKKALINMQYVSQVIEIEEEKVGACLKIYNSDGSSLIVKGTRDDLAELIYPPDKNKICPELKFVETIELEDKKETANEE